MIILLSENDKQKHRIIVDDHIIVRKMTRAKTPDHRR